VESIRPPPTLLPSSPGANWWAPTLPSHHMIHPVEPWRVIPSSPSSSDGHSPLTSSAPVQPLWTGLSMDFSSEMESPVSHYTTSPPTGYYQSAPMTSQMPLPSLVAQQCNPSNIFGFSWNSLQDYTTI
jgi:hypothetical protein